MGYLVTRGSKAGARSQGGARGRLAESYNRSSLAVDFEEDGAALAWKPMPQLVPRPMIVNGPAPRMFRGLEPALFKKDKRSNAVSFCIHVGVIGAILWWSFTAHPVVHDETTTVPIKFVLTDPPVMQVAKQEGGGGGAHQVTAPVKARPQPKPVVPQPPAPVVPRVKMLPPQIAQVETPKLPEPTHQVNMELNSNVPQFNASNSPQVALKAPSAAAHSSFGVMGGGIGIGQSAGAGPGSGGGYGGGVMSVGGGVSAPILIHSVQPEFTEQARRSDLQGTVAIELIVDSQGNPQDVRVVRRLGMGLDQKAVEAVRQYKFKPAMYQGHPVSVQMVVDVDFRLH